MIVCLVICSTGGYNDDDVDYMLGYLFFWGGLVMVIMMMMVVVMMIVMMIRFSLPYFQSLSPPPPLGRDQCMLQWRVL